MNLFKQTLKSYTSKERMVSFLLLAVFAFTGFDIFFNPQGITIGGQDAIYSEGLVGEITHLNPVFTEFNEVDGDISSLIFSGLVKYNAQTGEFEEDLATHTLSEDKLTYNFVLKNDLKWHDGEPVTAEDVYYTYAEVIQSPEFNNPILKSTFFGAEIELKNSREISFTLNSPNSFFFTALTVGILPKHILGETPVSELDTHEFNRQPIGTGPYVVTNPYEFGTMGETSVVLASNDFYYGEKPELKSLRFIAYPSYADLIDRRSEWNGSARIKASQLSELEDETLVAYEYELPQYTALFFNTDAPNLNQNAERLGVAKAIDKQEIIESIGGSVAVDTPLLQLDQEKWIHQHDTDEAQGSLFEAGWELDVASGLRKNDRGQTMELTLVRRDFAGINERQESTTLLAASMIQEQLRNLGIQVNVESYSMDELGSVIQNREYDMLLYGQGLGYNLDVFSYWHSSQASEEGLNLSNYQNAKADFLMEEVRVTFDAEERESLLEGLADIIAQDVPAVFLYTPSYYYLVDTKVTGLEFKQILQPRDRFSNIAAWLLN